MLVLTLFTALVIFALLLAFQLAGTPINRSGRHYSPAMLVGVALSFALMIAVIQTAALGLIRLLPWQGPSLRVEGNDHLRQVFE